MVEPSNSGHIGSIEFVLVSFRKIILVSVRGSGIVCLLIIQLWFYSVVKFSSFAVELVNPTLFALKSLALPVREGILHQPAHKLLHSKT